MGVRWRLTNETTLEQFSAFVRNAWSKGHHPTVEFLDHRTLDQNSLIYAWYSDIAKARGDMTALNARCMSKYWCGLPILMTESEVFRDRWDRLIRNTFEYEQKLELMEWFPVSSLMSKKQLSQYLERMHEYWGKNGVQLEWPEVAS